MNFKEERYEAEVPDTLDLAERALFALNVLTRVPDPQKGYSGYHIMNFYSRPPYMRWPPGCMEKYLEALPMMRVMCGSEQNLDIDKEMMETLGTKEGGPRVMLAMMYWYDRDRDPSRLTRIGEIAEELCRMAIYRDVYAYYPLESRFSKEKGIWEKPTKEERASQGDDRREGYLAYHPSDEPAREQQGVEGHVKREATDVAAALARWYTISGSEKALELSRKLINYVLKPGLWELGRPDIDGPGHAQFDGHFHGNVRALRGILEYALVTGNQRLKQFVRYGYEYARNFGIARIGWFPHWTNPEVYRHSRWTALVCEACNVADMTALAIKLSDAGVGDYWEDVDQYVRNQLVESQVIRADLLEKMSETGPVHVVNYGCETDDNVIERMIGSFGNHVGITSIIHATHSCCTGNCAQALYYAWEGIIRCKDDVAQVNLLLNRASPWLDIDSYLPYEGKVVIKNKTAKKLSVRIPMWVDKEAVKSKINRKEASPFWVGNHLVFDKLDEKDVVTIEFPIMQETAKYSIRGMEYTLHFKGNTLVDISPREDNPGGYPTYLRDHYKKDKAPIKKINRYISNTIIRWV